MDNNVYIISDCHDGMEYQSIVLRLKNAGYIVKSYSSNYTKMYGDDYTKNDLIKMRISTLLSCSKVYILGNISNDISKIECEIAKLMNKKSVKLIGFYR